jgi:uncharacterized protein (TIGR02271 family)
MSHRHAQTDPEDPLSQNSQSQVIIPVLAEGLVVEKVAHDTGGVRATKSVRERVQVVDEPLSREEITVERKAVNQVLTTPAQPRQEGDTLVIPVMEEILVVERRLLLKEEIHIHKRRKEVHDPRRFVLRSEEVSIEQLSPAEMTDCQNQPAESPAMMKGGVR